MTDFNQTNIGLKDEFYHLIGRKFLNNKNCNQQNPIAVHLYYSARLEFSSVILPVAK